MGPKFDPIVIVAGAKTDLAEKRKVSYEEARAFALEIDASYIEVSSAINSNVNSLFDMVSSQILLKILNSH